MSKCACGKETMTPRTNRCHECSRTYQKLRYAALKKKREEKAEEYVERLAGGPEAEVPESLLDTLGLSRRLLSENLRRLDAAMEKDKSLVVEHAVLSDKLSRGVGLLAQQIRRAEKEDHIVAQTLSREQKTVLLAEFFGVLPPEEQRALLHKLTQTYNNTRRRKKYKKAL